MAINNCVFNGRLVANAETKVVSDTFSVTNFAIAINERIKDKDGNGWTDRPNYVNLSLFGKYGETLRPLLKKGREVTVVARLHQERWEKDGKKFERIIFYCDNIVLQRESKQATGEKKTEQTGNSEETPQEIKETMDAIANLVPNDTESAMFF